MRRAAFVILALGIGGAAFFGIAEIGLRVLPIPGIHFDVSRYDPLTGGSLYPGSEVRYRNAEGELIRRKVNGAGYLDREWRTAKSPGITRIGFFGDSYTEARQVPLAKTFFRRIEDHLRPDGVECLAFGANGYSPVQSYLNFTRVAPVFDFDMVVYVFCENDVSDQIPALKRADTIPYPVLDADGNGFTVDDSFRERYRVRERPYFRALDYLTSHSLVFATLSSRLKLLARYGVKTRVTEADRMNPAAPLGGMEDGGAGDLGFVDQWPDSLRNHGWRLEEAVISRWKREVESTGGGPFVIMYIPREDELTDASIERRTWKPYLRDFCARESIPFLDPVPRFVGVQAAGERVYRDHFTNEGHEAFAQTFVDWYRGRAAAGADR